MNGREKSDPAIVARKLPNGAGRPAEEAVERRAGAEGNAGQHCTHRAQNRGRVTQALDRVRRAARQRKKERFTALLHQVNPDTLRLAEPEPQPRRLSVREERALLRALLDRPPYDRD